MSGGKRVNFWLDITLFVAGLVTAASGALLWLVIPSGRASIGKLLGWGLLRETWINIHEWTAVVALVGIAVHVALHWSWVCRLGSRFFGRLRGRARLNFSVDALLFVACFVVGLSGLLVWLVIPSGGYQGGRNPFYGATYVGLNREGWNDLHIWAGVAMAVIFAMHLIMHWGWLIATARHYTRSAVAGLRPRGRLDEVVS